MKDEDVGEGLVPSRCPKRKTARLKDFDYAQANTVFFITLCSLGKRQVFVRHDFNVEVVGCIKKERERVNHAVYVFCLMPEHIHLLSLSACLPVPARQTGDAQAGSPIGSGIPITRFMGGLSSQITRLSWRYGLSGRLLQRSFYDHVIRKDEDLRRIAE